MREILAKRGIFKNDTYIVKNVPHGSENAFVSKKTNIKARKYYIFALKCTFLVSYSILTGDTRVEFVIYCVLRH